MRSLNIAATGHAGAAAQCRGHLEQHRQPQHHRLQAPARRVPGSALSDRAARRRRPRPIPARSCRSACRSARASRRRRSIACRTQGNLINTNNPLDLAIQGHGYFQIQMPDGTTAYTRDGSLQLSPTGEIVTADGYVVQPGITLPAEHDRRHRSTRTARCWRRSPASRRRKRSASCSSRTFPNEAGLAGPGRQLSAGDAGLGLRRSSAIPARPRSARSSRAISRPRTSTSSPRSPTSSRRSAPMR